MNVPADMRLDVENPPKKIPTLAPPPEARKHGK
jgi:hypothetical protein